MKTLRNSLAGLLCLGAAAFAALPVAAEEPNPAPAPLVVHEWGTFTSFSGSNGTPAVFTPNYTDLPGFVYSQNSVPNVKAVLLRNGTVSMETPVMYFYADRPLKLAVKVGFPKGWITEWYPFASTPPGPVMQREAGQTMQWDVKLLAGEAPALPGRIRDERDHYYFARETDAVPVQTEIVPRQNEPNRNAFDTHGNTIVQREKFLFYRGVGTFPPPIRLTALGKSEVKIVAAENGSVDGLVLVSVRGGKVGFKVLGNLEAGGELRATIPDANGDARSLGETLRKQLTAAGLYAKESSAMVKTWESAWFGEEGTRLLYLVPRAKTDELLPVTITPKPDTLVRVLVGRHDFLTPEQEAEAERLVKRSRAARAELEAAEAELRRIGRFQQQAREQAEQRLDGSRPR